MILKAQQGLNTYDIKDNPYASQMQQLNDKTQQEAQQLGQKLQQEVQAEQNPTQLPVSDVTVKRKWQPGQYYNSKGNLAINAEDVLKNGYTFVTRNDGKLFMVDKNNGYRVIIPDIAKSPYLMDWIDKNGLWDKAENLTQAGQRMMVTNKDAIQQVRDDMRWGSNVAGAGLAAVALAPAAAELALSAPAALQKGVQYAVERVLPNMNLGTLGETLLTKAPQSLMNQGYKYPLLLANTGLGAGVNAAQTSYFSAEALNQLKQTLKQKGSLFEPTVNTALALSPLVGVPAAGKLGASVKRAGQWFGNNVVPENWKNVRYFFQYGPAKSWRNLRNYEPRIPSVIQEIETKKQIAFPDLYKLEQSIKNSSEFNKTPEPIFANLVLPTEEVKFGNITSTVQGQTLVPDMKSIPTKFSWRLAPPHNKFGFTDLEYNPPPIPTNFKTTLIPSRFSNPEIVGAVREYETEMNKVLNGEGLVTGSTVGVGRGLIQNQVNNDTEIITTAARLGKAQNNIKFQQIGTNGLGDAKGISKFAKGNTNEVDFDVIQENENGQAVGKLAHQIYATLHPEEASKLYKAHELQDVTTYNIPLPVSAEQLFQELKQGDNVVKVHLSDVLFMGANMKSNNPANAKQGYRAFNILTMPEQQSAVESAILTKGKSLFGSTWERPSTQVAGFDDVEANKRFLQEVINGNSDKQYFTTEQINEIAHNSKQMQNIFDVYYMNNFYGLRAQGRYSPYVGRDLTNQELLNGFTENIQYGGGTGSGVGQNHTSGGISAFSLDYPFRSVRIGQVSYKPNLTLNDFVDQFKRITSQENFPIELYSNNPKAVKFYSVDKDLPMWRSMTTARGQGAYGGSYVGMLDIQTDPSKYSIFYNWTPEVGQTFSNKWMPARIAPRAGDQAVDKLQIGIGYKFSPEFERLLDNYSKKLFKIKYIDSSHPSWDLAQHQFNKQNQLAYDKYYNVKDLKNKFQSFGAASLGTAALGGLGAFVYNTTNNNPTLKYFKYTLNKYPKYSEEQLDNIFSEIEQSPNVKTEEDMINAAIPKLKSMGYDPIAIKTIIRYYINNNYEK